MSEINVVIFARGQSTRTQSYEHGNKVYYRFRSRPFLSYVIDSLQGADRIVVLARNDEKDNSKELIGKAEFRYGDYKHSLLSYWREIEDLFTENSVVIFHFGDVLYPDLDLQQFWDYGEFECAILMKSYPSGGYFVNGELISSRYQIYHDLGVYRVTRKFLEFCAEYENQVEDFWSLIRILKNRGVEIGILAYHGRCFEIGSLKGILKFKRYIGDTS